MGLQKLLEALVCRRASQGPASQAAMAPHVQCLPQKPWVNVDYLAQLTIISQQSWDDLPVVIQPMQELGFMVFEWEDSREKA
jgi:hypothetical protein